MKTKTSGNHQTGVAYHPIPQSGWTAQGAESGTKFEDIDLTEGDWADYDEKVCQDMTSFIIVAEEY